MFDFRFIAWFLGLFDDDEGGFCCGLEVFTGFEVFLVSEPDDAHVGQAGAFDSFVALVDHVGLCDVHDGDLVLFVGEGVLDEAANGNQLLKSLKQLPRLSTRHLNIIRIQLPIIRF